MTSAPHLYALPAHRRLDLIARAPHLTEQQLSDRLARAIEQFGPACPGTHQQRGHLLATAVLGDDGRFHLRLGTAMVCSHHARALVDFTGPMPAAGTAVPHFYLPGWWTDGHEYRAEAITRPGTTGYATVRWTVTLTDHQERPELVDHDHRCQINAHEGDWDPRPAGPSGSWRIRLRTAYTAAGGRMCHACRTSLAQHLDYDRHTLLVRGVLCKDCSTHITECPHPAGCYRADYLNDPPAAHLRRRYYAGGNRSDRNRRGRQPTPPA